MCDMAKNRLYHVYPSTVTAILWHTIDALTWCFCLIPTPTHSPRYPMPDVLHILMTATNTTPMPIGDFVFQAAVPPMYQIALQAPSGNALLPNSMGAH